MTDFRTILANLRRPRLLIHAARFGLQDYCRDRDLRRILSVSGSPERVLPELLAEEQRLEQRRQTGDVTYPVARHIAVLAALMAEVRLLPQRLALSPRKRPASKRRAFCFAIRDNQRKASGIDSFLRATKPSSPSRMPSSRCGC